MYNDRTHTMLDPFPFATSPQVLSQSDLSTTEYSTGFKVTTKPFSSATGVKVLQTLPRSAAGLPMGIVWWEEGRVPGLCGLYCSPIVGVARGWPTRVVRHLVVH